MGAGGAGQGRESLEELSPTSVNVVRYAALEEESGGNSRKRATSLTIIISFWLMGLINNGGYVIMIAGAKDIVEGAVGLVFLADVLPSFFIKLSGPSMWYHLVNYQKRALACAVLMAGSFLCVGLSTTRGWKLLGVALCSAQSGIGESSLLAMAGIFKESKKAITMWSSGTGFAGIFGFAWVYSLTSCGLDFSGAAFVALCLPLVWLVVFGSLLRAQQLETIENEEEGWKVEGVEDEPGAMADEEEEKGDAEDDRDAVGALELTTARQSMQSKARFIASLWHYTVPLVTVYYAEYTMQAGVWSSIGFPVSDRKARASFYTWANWCYQMGVFVSRSSGMLCPISKRGLWAMPCLQILLLLFFWEVAVHQFMPKAPLLALCFGTGLIGGTVYVGCFLLIAQDSKITPDRKELALGAASVGDSFGILLSNITSLFVQERLGQEEVALNCMLPGCALKCSPAISLFWAVLTPVILLTNHPQACLYSIQGIHEASSTRLAVNMCREQK